MISCIVATGEGYGLRVLETLDFSIRPGVIKIEHKQLSKFDRRACLTLLEQQGYLVSVEQDDFFAIG